MIAPNPCLDKKVFTVVEASISELREALNTGAITSVDLVSKYLERIASYDANGLCLNSVCVLNPRILEEARASDRYRASGGTPRPLEGIPFTVKDCVKVEGMTVANGSPAFANLTANSDAAVVEFLRDAGAIVLGRTNMPPMADGGAQRGLYGRAESPYNSACLTTAFASGSSNGAGTSIAASFAAFGFGGETVSSGRAPAATNALIAYSPSRGVISNRGWWPLYPTCDVAVPMTRTMDDLLEVLDVIVKDDHSNDGDFWRQQSWVEIPKASTVRPDNYRNLQDPQSLVGKKIGVPSCYLGKTSDAVLPSAISESMLEIWQEAVKDLQALGATVVETKFPLMENYSRQDWPGQSANVAGIDKNWCSIERLELISIAWDDFLRSNGDPKLSNLSMAQADRVYPFVSPMDDPAQYTEAQNHIKYAELLQYASRRPNSIFDLPGCQNALECLEAMRKRDWENWLVHENIDCLAFPTLGDSCSSDSDTSLESVIESLREGVKYANGGRALKHLGIPAITVPMGMTSDKNMPGGITFIGAAYSDNNLLSYAYAYEKATQHRVAPPLTPALPSDVIHMAPSVAEDC